ncbi:MAG: PAS domain S-box protein [Longimicrobiales bacterium]|nr:PAS domain S-box protein [Longimicrobiales bacterium]
MSNLPTDGHRTALGAFPLVLVLLAVCVALGAAGLLMAYRAEVENAENWLQQGALSRARLIEDRAASHGQADSVTQQSGAIPGILAEIRGGEFPIWFPGPDAELHLFALAGESLVPLLDHAASGGDSSHSPEFERVLRRAAAGESGMAKIETRAGVRSLVAYVPVRVPGWRLGLAATMALGELRAPFFRMAMWAGLLTLALTLGAFLVIQGVAEPGRRRLRESERRLRSLYESEHVGVGVISATGELLHVNDRAAEILDLPPDRVLGTTASDSLWEMVDEKGDPVAREDRPAQVTLRTGQPIRNALLGLVSGDPVRTRWHLVSTEPLFDGEGGRIAEVVVTFADVTELRESEKAVQEAAGRMTLAQEVAGSGLMDTDLPSGRSFWSPRTFELLGLDPSRTDPGLDAFASLLLPEDRAKVLAGFEDTGSDEASPPFVITVTHSTGGVVQLAGRTAVYRGGANGQHRAVTVLRDVTAENEVRNEHAKSAERLQALLGLAQMEGAGQRELVRHGLEAMVRLTDSEVGYVHLYDSESGAIEFYEWSAEARRRCTADPVVHHDLEKAGVWADCIRLGRPVIHNDYPSLATRKGTPPGHFPMTRHLAVPCLDGGRVVMVAGVGNKAALYTEVDAEQLTLFLSSLWALYKKEALLASLRASEERLRLSQRVGRVGLMDRDLTTDEEVWSDVTFEILGLDPAGTAPGPAAWLGALHPDDRHRALRALGGALHGEDAPLAEYRVVHPTEGVRWITGTARAFPTLEGRYPGRILVTIHDITKLKSAQGALASSERRFRSVYANAPLGIVLLDPGGRIMAANPAYCLMLGYEERDLLGKEASTVAHPDDRAATATFRRRMLQGEIPGFTVEQRYVTKSGEALWGRSAATVVRDDSGAVRYGLAFVQDVTAERWAEEEMRTSREELRALTAHLVEVREEERAFLSRELHDGVGQTFTGLRMDLALLRSDLPADRDDLAGQIGGLIEGIDEGVDLVREISSRLRPPMLDLLGLGPALEWQVDEHRRRTDSRFHLDLADGLPPPPPATATALFRIAQEALTNVVRHAGASSVWVTLRREDGALALEVRDDGVGTSTDVLRSPSALGIVGMRERALALGGDVSVERASGGGTVVRARIPIGAGKALP